MTSHFSLSASRVFFLSLNLDYLIIIYLFEFILLEVHRPSWMCRSMCSIRSGKFLVIISVNILSIPFSLSFLLLGLVL